MIRSQLNLDLSFTFVMIWSMFGFGLEVNSSWEKTPRCPRWIRAELTFGPFMLEIRLEGKDDMEPEADF